MASLVLVHGALILALVLSVIGIVVYLILQATALQKPTSIVTTPASVQPTSVKPTSGSVATTPVVSSETSAAILEQEALFPLTMTQLKKYALREGFKIRESFYAEIESDYELGRRIYVDFVNLLPTSYKSNMQCTIPSTRIMTRADMIILKNQMDCILMQLNPVHDNADLMTALYMLWLWSTFIADTSGKVTVKTIHADVLYYAQGKVFVLLPDLLEEVKTAGFMASALPLAEWSRFMIRKGTLSHTGVNGTWPCTCEFSKIALQQSIDWLKPVLELVQDTTLANVEPDVAIATLYDRCKMYTNPLQQTSIACFVKETLPVDKMLSTMECAPRLLKNQPPSIALFFLYHVTQCVWENRVPISRVYAYDTASSMVELKHASLLSDIPSRSLSIYALHQALAEKSKVLTSPDICPC